MVELKDVLSTLDDTGARLVAENVAILEAYLAAAVPVLMLLVVAARESDVQQAGLAQLQRSTA